MKELNKFRQFINEGKENVDELFGLRGKPDSTKKAAKALDALEKALFELNFLDILGQEDYEDWLIKYEELRGRVMAGLDDESREKYDVALMDDEELDENDAAEGQIHEGTWGYGSKNQMLKALDKLNKIKQMGGVKGSVELSKIDDMLYNVFGNDDFHDSIDQAKDAAIDDDQFANYIGDAQAKGMKMLNDIYSDLEENDRSLDEIIGEEKEEIKEGLFDEIDMMMDKLAVHMSAGETLRDLMGEFEAISGGPKVLHMALKNLMMGAGLMEEEKGEE